MPGEVFYGNIGSKDRLDFTVVGPAVNEVSRIAAMCRSIDQPVLLSAAFAASVADERRGAAVTSFRTAEDRKCPSGGRSNFRQVEFRQSPAKGGKPIIPVFVLSFPSNPAHAASEALLGIYY